MLTRLLSVDSQTANMTRIGKRPISIERGVGTRHGRGHRLRDRGNQSEVGTLAERTALCAAMVRSSASAAADRPFSPYPFGDFVNAVGNHLPVGIPQHPVSAQRRGKVDAAWGSAGAVEEDALKDAGQGIGSEFAPWDREQARARTIPNPGRNPSLRSVEKIRQ